MDVILEQALKQDLNVAAPGTLAKRFAGIACRFEHPQKQKLVSTEAALDAKSVCGMDDKDKA